MGRVAQRAVSILGTGRESRYQLTPGTDSGPARSQYGAEKALVLGMKFAIETGQKCLDLMIVVTLRQPVSQ